MHSHYLLYENIENNNVLCPINSREGDYYSTWITNLSSGYFVEEEGNDIVNELLDFSVHDVRKNKDNWMSEMGEKKKSGVRCPPPD